MIGKRLFFDIAKPGALDQPSQHGAFFDEHLQSPR
jgi:hypothetical protein